MKPRVLVLGATGMLGHTLLRWLALDDGYDAIGYARTRERLTAIGSPVVGGGLRGDALIELLARTKPDVAINCIGIVKQSAAVADLETMTAINAELPHRLARACADIGAEIIHISTDCVFSGARGNYSELDTPDPIDAYGRTKLAGEPSGPGTITLRTSIVGPELGSGHGLLSWFFKAKTPIPGYACARFSGVTTLQLAKIITQHVLPRPRLEGIYHVAGPPITKHDLLDILARVWRPGVEIVPQDRPVIDRTLDGSHFAHVVGWRAPGWPEMVEAMRAFG